MMGRPTMSMVESLQHFLGQAKDLTRRLDPVAFSTCHALCYGANVGQHLRHCLDHVESFLDGLPVGRVDYDARRRGVDSEGNPDLALARIDSAIERLGRSPLDEAQTLLVKLDCGLVPDPWSVSTVGRELQFLISHLVHHFAIVSIMCRFQGVDPGEEFGVAPSTLRHRLGA